MKKNRYNTSAYGETPGLFYGILAILLGVVICYMYFLCMSVVHVVMRKEIDVEMRELTTKVSELEAEYIERQHAVSSDIAEMKGFVLADSKIFIDKSADTLVLSRN